MAGYIPAKLLKENRRGSKNLALDLKYKLFVKTLQHMKAHQQLDSLFEYSKLWMEVIDHIRPIPHHAEVMMVPIPSSPVGRILQLTFRESTRSIA